MLALRGMPGWLAAWLMPLVPTLSRAIWAGHRRLVERPLAKRASRRVAMPEGSAA
jgi:hypothetical protein